MPGIKDYHYQEDLRNKSEDRRHKDIINIQKKQNKFNLIISLTAVGLVMLGTVNTTINLVNGVESKSSKELIIFLGCCFIILFIVAIVLLYLLDI
ncbi:MAG: hypothetical protein ISS82_06070 [Nanoarchaeota archaeon]|nr:hypothetical protein [Nanoarchaeota archaeon]